MIPLITKKILHTINSVSKENKTDLFIVGGFLRDLLIKKNLNKVNKLDIDLILKKDIEKLVKKISKELSSKYFVLEKNFNTYRILVKDNQLLHQLDFSLFKADTIQQDLEKRDFTINAFAIKLSSFIKIQCIDNIKNQLLSVPGAIQHLREKIISCINNKTFQDDPLRILRCFSIAAYLEFSIDSKTLHLSHENAFLLKEVSGERVRDEIFRLFLSNNSASYLKLMDQSGVLSVVFPELNACRNVEQGPYHKLDVFFHSIDSIDKFEKFLPEIYKHSYLSSRIKKYLENEISVGRKRKCLIKFALLYHDTGKPEAMHLDKEKIKFWGHEKISRNITAKTCKRFKLSNLEKKSVENMVYYHLRPGNLIGSDVTKKAVYRFYRQAQEDTPALILLSIADKYATAGEWVTEKSMDEHKKLLIEILEEYFYLKEEKKPHRLVDGNDVMKILKIGPSNKVGEILEEIKLLQMEGKIKNKDEALEFIKNYK